MAISYIPILPVGMLELGPQVGFHDAFILPAMWNISAYREFYMGRKWHNVIIDNDVYESGECTPISELVEIADSLSASTINIVGYEKMGDIGSTLNGILSNYSEHEDIWDKYNLMMVLDGTPNEMKEAFSVIKEYDISISIPVSLYRKGYDRAALLTYIGVDRHYDGYVHALGIDNAMEVISLGKAGYDSVDSSIVATAAVNEVNLDKEYIIRRTEENQIPRVDLMQTNFTTGDVSSTMVNLTKMINLQIMGSK